MGAAEEDTVTPGFDPVVIAGGIVAGFGAGALYFGGLWLTSKRAVRSGRPLRLLAASALVRLAPLLLVFFLLVRWHPLAALSGMGGFLLARLLWTGVKGGRGWN